MKIDHIQLAIPAGAEDKCRAIWITTLGFAELEKPARLRARGGAWFRHGKTEIHLGVDNDFTPATKAHPAFEVSNLNDIAQSLSQAGYAVRPDIKIEGRDRFFTDDPVGNRIEFLDSTKG